MDNQDRKLIGLLQADGRASNAQLARRMGVSEGTVRRRLKRLSDRGSLQVVAVPNPEHLGHHTEALVGIQADLDKGEGVAGELAQIPEVDWVSVTTGSFDIFAWVAVPSSDELRRFLRERVARISGVRRTETFVNLVVKKRPHVPVTQ